MAHKKPARRHTKKGSSRFPKKKMIILLLFLLISFLIYKGVVIYSNLSESSIKSVISKESVDHLFVKQGGLEKTSVILEGEDYKIEGVWQIIKNTNTSESAVFYIPSWVYFEDHSDSYVDYISVRDFLYTGRSINNELGHEYSIWQLQNLTGISSDSYIWLGSSFREVYSDIFGKLDIEDINYDSLRTIIDRYSLIALLDHSEDVSILKESIMSNHSDLAVLDDMRTVSSVFSYEDTEVIDISEDWALSEAVNRNGDDISIVNIYALDERIYEIEEIIRSSEIEKELVEIEVYNGSSISGVAGRYARRFQNGGVDVIRYDNSPIDYEKSTIYIPDSSRFENSLDLIIELMDDDVEVVNGRPDFMTTGDIVVILGEDIDSSGIIVK